MGEMDLRRRVLLNHDFDLYVGQYVEAEPFDPDALYPLLHSRFSAETGWQNPFGLTDFSIDEQVTDQRTVPADARQAVVEELQESVAEIQPFTVVAFPDSLTAIRDGRFSGWGAERPLSVEGLLGLSRHADTSTDESEDGDETVFDLVTTDQRITENWNPIAPEYRRHGTFTSLLYDQLVRIINGTAVPWLAKRWEWIDDDELELTLRDAQWHDGEPVRAADVEFTLAFLQDTSLGNAETPVPAPKFRGRSSAIDSVRVVDTDTLRLHLDGVNRRVGVRAMEVPVLPEHIWKDRTELATVAGVEFDGETTEAVVSNNAEPVGNGPLQLVDAAAEVSVEFERNTDHFLTGLDDGSTDEEESIAETTAGDTADDRLAIGERDVVDASVAGAGIPARFQGKPAFDRLTVEVVPSDIAAVQAVSDGRADGTISNLGPDSVPRIGRESDVRLVSTRSAAFYHIGYNTRQAPLSNPRFRGILASLIDKSALIDDAFDGYAEPAVSPLATTPEWVPAGLEWPDDDRDPVYPFLGEDGEVDVEVIRDELRAIGYRFNDEGELLSRAQ